MAGPWVDLTKLPLMLLKTVVQRRMNTEAVAAEAKMKDAHKAGLLQQKAGEHKPITHGEHRRCRKHAGKPAGVKTNTHGC